MIPGRVKATGNTHTGGVVLLVTLVVLVALATLASSLTVRLSSQKRRGGYMIDYQAARYACDSAVKYALAELDNIQAKPLSRPNVPDFSDLFAMTEENRQVMLDEWNQRLLQLHQEQMAEESMEGFFGVGDNANFSGAPRRLSQKEDSNDYAQEIFLEQFDPNEPNTLYIPGPYGPRWPLVKEPAEIEIGSSKVTIEIHDENAKYPLGWAILDDDKIKKEAQASLEIFCEWMWSGSTDADVFEKTSDLKAQLKKIAEIKTFKKKFTPITSRTRAVSKSDNAKRGRQYRVNRKDKSIPVSLQIADFARLFHSSMLDTELLARPTIEAPERNESAKKYMGLWGSGKVNINTAPRHVLEAAFAFGGDYVEIAEEIIKRRREKPFKDMKDLEDALLGYSDSLKKCADFIIFDSRFYTIHITARQGMAKVSTVIAVRQKSSEGSPNRGSSSNKDQNKRELEKILVMSD